MDKMKAAFIKSVDIVNDDCDVGQYIKSMLLKKSGQSLWLTGAKTSWR